MNNSTKLTLFIIILLIALGFIYFVHKNLSAPLPAPQATTTTNKNSQNTQAVHQTAPNGQLISGFPNDLILNASSSPQESYSETGASYKQYTTLFNSEQSIDSEYNAYLNYFQDQNYSFENKTETPRMAVIYCRDSKTNSDYSVQMNSQGSGILVVASYLKK